MGLLILTAALPAAADPVVRPRLDSYLYSPSTELGERTDLYLMGSDIGLSTLGYELRRVPGVQIWDLGGTLASSYASIRGSSSEQVQVLLDGVPLHEAYDGAFDLSLMPTTALARARIYRTPMTLERASPRPGGTIDLRTGIDRRDVVAGGSFGSYATRRLQLLGTAESYSEDYGFSLVYSGNSGSYSAFDDGGTPFQTFDDGYVDRDNNGVANFSTMLSYHNDLWEWDLDGFMWFVHDNRDLARFAGQSVDSLSHRQWRLVTGGRATATDWIDDLRLEMVGALSFGRSTLRDADDELDGVGSRGRDATFHAFLSIRPTWILVDAVALRTLLELQVEGMDPSNDADQSPINDAQRITFSTAMDTSASLIEDVLRVEGGVRLDHRVDRELRGSDVIDAIPETTLSPRIALAFQHELSEWDEHSLQLDFTWHQAYRPPTFAERFGDRDQNIGNTGLAPEESEQFTLGGAFVTGGDVRMVVGYGYFLRRIHDGIEPVFDGAEATYDNSLTTLTYGHELRTGIDIYGRFGAAWSMTYAPSFDRSEGVETRLLLPERAPVLVDLDLWARVGGLTLEHRIDVRGGAFADRQNEIPMPFMPTLDFAVRYSPRYSWDSWSVGLEMRNALNLRSGVTTREVGDVEVEVERAIEERVGHPQEGRTFFATFTWAPGN